MASNRIQRRPRNSNIRNITSMRVPPAGREKRLKGPMMLAKAGGATQFPDHRNDGEHRGGRLHRPLVGSGAEVGEEEGRREELQSAASVWGGRGTFVAEDAVQRPCAQAREPKCSGHGEGLVQEHLGVREDALVDSAIERDGLLSERRELRAGAARPVRPAQHDIKPGLPEMWSVKPPRRA